MVGCQGLGWVATGAGVAGDSNGPAATALIEKSVVDRVTHDYLRRPLIKSLRRFPEAVFGHSNFAECCESK